MEQLSCVTRQICAPVLLSGSFDRHLCRQKYTNTLPVRWVGHTRCKAKKMTDGWRVFVFLTIIATGAIFLRHTQHMNKQWLLRVTGHPFLGSLQLLEHRRYSKHVVGLSFAAFGQSGPEKLRKRPKAGGISKKIVCFEL